MVKASCLFWEEMVSSLGNTTGHAGVQCHVGALDAGNSGLSVLAGTELQGCT